jgi:hypothetical protein
MMIKTVASMGFIGTINPIAVQGAGIYVMHIPMPDLVTVFR